MTLKEFLSVARVLHCLDYHEFENVFDGAKDWVKFRDNPIQYIIRCPDDKAAVIWAIARKRLGPQASAADDLKATIEGVFPT